MAPAANEREKVVVLDGGMATQLSRHVSCSVDGHPLWSAVFLASHPDAVRQAHLDFLRGGAEAIITNTYQASIGGFKTHLNLSAEESRSLIIRAVELAKEACDTYMKENISNPEVKRPLVVGSVGPYGACLHDFSEYTGEYVDRTSKEEMMAWHRPRIQSLVSAGVDLLAMETIPAQAEGEALVELIKEFPGQRAWLSFSCNDEKHTCHGDNFQECVIRCWNLNPSQLVAVGANCIKPKFVTPLFRGINNSNRKIPLIAYPNSGEIFIPSEGWTKKEEYSHISTFTKEWLDLGVVYVGGCCRTYAEDITRIKKKVNEWINDIQMR